MKGATKSDAENGTARAAANGGGSLNVAVVLHLAHSSHRDVLHGISRAVTGRDRWNFRVVDYALWRNRETMREVVSEWANGVITTGPDDPVVEESLFACRGPLVVVGTPPAPDV